MHEMRSASSSSSVPYPCQAANRIQNFSHVNKFDKIIDCTEQMCLAPKKILNEFHSNDTTLFASVIPEAVKLMKSLEKHAREQNLHRTCTYKARLSSGISAALAVIIKTVEQFQEVLWNSSWQ